MTPLATRLVEASIDQATFPDTRSYLRSVMYDVHTFDCTEVCELVEELIDASNLHDVLQTLLFLPAPKTWIEYDISKRAGSGRVGILLEELDDRIDAILFTSESLRGRRLGAVVTNGGVGRFIPDIATAKELEFDARTAERYLRYKFLFLVLINTPKIIGRRQFMPTASLEKKLTRGFGIGKFPLHAWTEIKLNVTKPIEIDDGVPHEAHLTGRRALHFCRAHLRIRMGRLEYVSSHWRGDPAIGIKQSRYKLSA